jgi:pyrimidine deaminase RibD-like protein
MKLRDYQIHSRGKLDSILAECCRLVLDKNSDDPDFWGMVGACVLDEKNRVVFGVNHLVDGDLRDHAEVAAIKNYIDQYGEEGISGSIIITTLSPCCKATDQPEERNCTEYISNLGIKKVYCGFKDAEETHAEVYQHKKFHLAETRNRKLRHLCEKMAATFLDL